MTAGSILPSVSHRAGLEAQSEGTELKFEPTSNHSCRGSTRITEARASALAYDRVLSGTFSCVSYVSWLVGF